MDKGMPPTLFVNDGSFMERFKQLQQKNGEKDKDKDKGATSEEPKPIKIIAGTSIPHNTSGKTSMQFKGGEIRKTAPTGKLAFSLKQKSKLVAPSVKLGADEDEDEPDAVDASDHLPEKRQKLGPQDDTEQPVLQSGDAPPSPSDPTVKKVADKLASFVAKHGRQFEHVTRQKNPGDTPFKFLFDESSADYKYYEYQLAQEEKASSETVEPKSSNDGGSTQTSKPRTGSQKSLQQSSSSNYQTPASALYEPSEDSRTSVGSSNTTAWPERAGETRPPPSSGDPIAMMEFYMKKAAREERMRQPKQSKDEMPPPASLQASALGKRGHHMGDFIPHEELEKFLATCNDASARKYSKEAADKAKIQADNVGHRLLSKMGWKEGEGLGSSKSGIADPIMAGDVKTNNLGVGAHQPGEVTPEDDIYEQYKKRMMLGYRYRPNPLNNPRKAYY
ncbi:SURP and G-patch domain-containing protein 1-like protein [Cucumis sativus]|uniref:Gamma reponse I-like protein n=1 Tax=Cucumis sativus TaxID=3659 RepID=B3TLK2_CUCSA|nr:SURP and G-patch domain-containing protein 1-like protein [Cucumis sativus]ACA24495.1 gamma reponse I-like protein [Cucumis sativus]